MSSLSSTAIELRHGLLPGLLCLCMALLTCIDVKAEPVAGRVLESNAAGQSLAGVAIDIVLSGTTRKLEQPTGADGSFRADLADLFSAQDLDTEILYIRFTKPGYLPFVFNRRTQHRGVFGIDDLEVRMEAAAAPQTDAGTVSAAHEDDLRRIYHAAYALYGGDAQGSGMLNQLNERLPRHLRRGIITHLQQLHLPVNVSVDELPGEVQQADSVALRAFARKENALAVIKGEAEWLTEDGIQMVEMASEYRVIPELPEFKPGTLHVDDRIPADQMRPSQLSRNLSKTWGGSTVFALALYETQEALRETDDARRQARLERAEQILKAQERDLPADDILKQQIQDLAGFIARARQP